jgi:uncharacterized alpha-E superfamily protein
MGAAMKQHMLSRAAEDLYWMSRYVERAENTARLLDVSYRMALLPSERDDETVLWKPAIAIGPAPEMFYERYGEATADNVLTYMALDADNPSSIYSSIRTARENARTQRTQLSTEMWESLNATWLELQDLDKIAIQDMGLRAFFDWIKERSHLFRGVTVGTMLRDEAFHFVRLGTFLERGDSTARLLDVKYHVLLPSAESVGGAQDYYQWGALLRSVSAFSTYKKIYRTEITPGRIAEMLILRDDVARSLRTCTNAVKETLELLAAERTLESIRLAGRIHADLQYASIKEIFARGLHEFLEDYIERNVAVGSQLQTDFLMAPVVDITD